MTYFTADDDDDDETDDVKDDWRLMADGDVK